LLKQRPIFKNLPDVERGGDAMTFTCVIIAPTCIYRATADDKYNRVGGYPAAATTHWPKLFNIL